ncbi:MAG: hypothetical protein JWO72_626 [Caulobacteraceae bacterium]|nr:hypothetical protein [Caulobacteraceae bacterium]
MAVSTADLVCPAMACLRVSINGAPAGQDGPDLQVLVAKLINAFLETRWDWPRRFEQMTPYAFVLTDPNAAKMDKRALKALASELQLKLFGVDGESAGEVSLLLFEGSDVEVHRFARLPAEDVTRMLAGQRLEPPFEGNLDRITAAPRREGRLARIEAATPAAIARALATADILDDLEVPPPFDRAPAPAPPARRLEPLFSPLYLTVTHSFIGNIALCRRAGTRRLPSLLGSTPLPEVSAEAFDEGCVEGAVGALSQGPGNLLFVPLSFSSLVRPAGRRAYARFLCHLPAEHKARLGAAIYDTPRDPSFFALSTIRRFLDPFFGEINLHVADPNFEIDKLAPGAVGSVTLVLPDAESAVRMSAARRFLQSRDLYKKKRVWPGLSPVLNQSELDMCLTLRAPVISGPGIARPSGQPVNLRAFDVDRLPLA